MGILRRIAPFLLLAVIAIVLVMTLRTSWLQATGLAKEEREKAELIAEATRRMADLNTKAQDFDFILHIIQHNETVPIILVNEQHTPLSLRNIEQKYLDRAELLPQLLREMARAHDPIPITLPSGDKCYVYYGSSATLGRLRQYPYIQLGFISVVVLLSLLTMRQTKQADQNRLWVGLAKETAHQLGTPISSLLAWIHLLRDDNARPEIVDSLSTDVDRLQRIADRFSKIGTLPQLNDTDIKRTIAESVSYMRPRISQKIALVYLTEDIPYRIPHNALLLEWVLENLIRNAVDAISGEGIISIQLRMERNRALIDCSDSGKGMSRKTRMSIFSPGFTTKTRGWGLGLSLARRIIRNYHHGHLFVLRSEPNRGTTFRIVLPLYQESLGL